MRFWYLDHSGVAVKTENHLLLFDIFGDILDEKDGQGLFDGRINVEDLKDEDVMVFVSHEHHDHFDMRIFELKDRVKNIRYVLPEEFDEVIKDAIFVHSNMEVRLPDCTITTFDSTDVGVAYLAEVDGKLIYHAGDLNWWHWEGEEDEFNLDQEKRYNEQMRLLKEAVGDRSIDLAFVPVDPRLEQDMFRGICCFDSYVKAKKIVPIHFWGDFGVCELVKTSPQTKGFADRVVTLGKRGESLKI